MHKQLLFLVLLFCILVLENSHFQASLTVSEIVASVSRASDSAFRVSGESLSGSAAPMLAVETGSNGSLPPA